MWNASSFVVPACHETLFRADLRKAEETLPDDGRQKMPLFELKGTDSPLPCCRQASIDALKRTQLLKRGNTRLSMPWLLGMPQQLKVLITVRLNVACGFSQFDLARVVINGTTPTPKPKWFREPLTTSARKL
jgi:hypothetical protein